MKGMSAGFDGTVRAPFDATAAKLCSPGVKLQEDYIPVAQMHWDTPPPMLTRGEMRDMSLCPDWENLTGKKVGRLTVLGVWAAKRTRWVVRCACGDYEVRTAKAIKGGSEMMCFTCGKLAYRKTAWEKGRRQG